MRIRKNGKVIRLTESDLRRITKKVLREQSGGSDKKHITDYYEVKNKIEEFKLEGDLDFIEKSEFKNDQDIQMNKIIFSSILDGLKKDNIYYSDIENFINDIPKNWVKGKKLELKLNVNGKEVIVLTLKPNPQPWSEKPTKIDTGSWGYSRGK